MLKPMKAALFAAILHGFYNNFTVFPFCTGSCRVPKLGAHAHVSGAVGRRGCGKDAKCDDLETSGNFVVCGFAAVRPLAAHC